MFYNSVPGDALLSAAINTSAAQTIEVLGMFGWKLVLVPLTTVAYFLIAYSLAFEPRLSGITRKKLLLGLLLYAMLSMGARQVFALKFKVPPLFEEYTANLCFPSNLVLSLTRVLRHQSEMERPTSSVQGRPDATLPLDQPMLVVLIIGESLRSDHLSINGYARNTTPQLAALGKEIITFSDVASTANWTNEAVPNIASRSTASSRVPLVQTFKEAGFRTAWLSHQEPTLLSRIADVSEHAESSADYHLRKDSSLLPLFTSFVSQAGARQFIVLHMIGSHIDYEERYNVDSRVFAPTLFDIGVGVPLVKNKTETINSYDNTIIETDKFIYQVIAILRAQIRPAVLLFTSDHGENLFDDERELFMHAQRIPTHVDTHVPLLVWMNAPYQTLYPAHAPTLQNNTHRKISHTNIFPTILELGGVTWNNQLSTESFASSSFEDKNCTIGSAETGNRLDYDSIK